MPRHSFGAGMADWTLSVGAGNAAILAGGLTITFWSAQSGGTQYTDLVLDAAGTTAADHVDSSSGAGGSAIGSIPQLWGPSDVWAMWASANGGPRQLMIATDLPAYVQSNVAALTLLQSQISTHLAAANPHGTRLVTLSDFTGTPTDGQLVQWNAATSKWMPASIPGLSNVVTVDTPQTITETKTFDTGDANKTRIVVRANASGQAADLFQAWSSADVGQGGAAQRTTYLNEKGELRAIPAAYNSVAARFKAQPGQTANVFEITDTGNNVMAWVSPNGSLRAPNLGHTFTLSVSGNLSVGIGKHRVYNDTGVTLTIRSVRVSVGTAPTGASVICDINKNGVSTFTSANRPTVAASASTSGKVVAISDVTLADGDYLTVDVDQVGSTVTGADLVAQILAY